MKALTIFVFIFSMQMAQATLEDCQLDAESYGSHIQAVTPSTNCKTLLEAEPGHISFDSPNGLNSLVAFGNMVYITQSGVTELLAGNNSNLAGATKAYIDDDNLKAIIYYNDQANSRIATYNMNHIGNVSPFRFVISESYADLSNVMTVNAQNQLALISQGEDKILFISNDADDRFQGSKYQKNILRKIEGPLTQLSSPTLVEESTSRSEIYVLDSDQILVFTNNPQGDVAPIRVISASGRSNATSMKLDATQDNLLFYNGTTALTSLSLN